VRLHAAGPQFLKGKARSGVNEASHRKKECKRSYSHCLSTAGRRIPILGELHLSGADEQDGVSRIDTLFRKSACLAAMSRGTGVAYLPVCPGGLSGWRHQMRSERVRRNSLGPAPSKILL
jgi:hypothetical protein